MANYSSANISFDDIFMKYKVGDKEIDTGYKFYDPVTNTYQDISSRYQMYKVGNQASRMNYTIMRNNTSVDISTLFQYINQSLINGSFHSFTKIDDPSTLIKCVITFTINVVNVVRYDISYLMFTDPITVTQITKNFTCDPTFNITSFQINVDGTLYPDVYNPIVTVYNSLNESVTFSCTNVPLVLKYTKFTLYAVGGGGGGGGGGRNVGRGQPDGGCGGGGGAGALEELDIYHLITDTISITFDVGYGGGCGGDQHESYGYGFDGQSGGTSIVYVNGNIALSALGGSLGNGGMNNNVDNPLKLGKGGIGGQSSTYLNGVNGTDGRTFGGGNRRDYIGIGGSNSSQILPYYLTNNIFIGNGGNGGTGGEKSLIGVRGDEGGIGCAGHVIHGNFYC